MSRRSWNFHVQLVMLMMIVMNLIEISLLHLIQVLVKRCPGIVFVVVTLKREFRYRPELARTRFCGVRWEFQATSILQFRNTMNFMDVILAARFMFARLEKGEKRKKERNQHSVWFSELPRDQFDGILRRYFKRFVPQFTNHLIRILKNHFWQLRKQLKKLRNLFNDIILKSLDVTRFSILLFMLSSGKCLK